MTARWLMVVASLLLVGSGGAAWAQPTIGAESGLAAASPLEGRTIVLDPGHQLGNHNFPRKCARLVPAGGFRKPCNTTGTATRGGYPEATFVWQVSQLLAARLQRAGRGRDHDPAQQPAGPVGSVRRRTRSQGQPGRGGPQGQRPRRRGHRPRGAGVPRDRPHQPPAVDARHLPALAAAGAGDQGGAASRRPPGRQLHRGRGRDRLPLRPRHPQPGQHPVRDGRARQHAQPA